MASAQRNKRSRGERNVMKRSGVAFKPGIAHTISTLQPSPNSGATRCPVHRSVHGTGTHRIIRVPAALVSFAAISTSALRDVHRHMTHAKLSILSSLFYLGVVALLVYFVRDFWRICTWNAAWQRRFSDRSRLAKAALGIRIWLPVMDRAALIGFVIARSFAGYHYARLRTH